MKRKSWTRTSIKITSYLGTDSGSSQAKPDEVKMVLYSRGVWNALFSLAVYKKTDVYKNSRSPAFIIFYLLWLRHERSTSRSRRRIGSFSHVTVEADMMQK